MTIKEIQQIIKDFESSPLMTLELEMEGFKLRLSKNKTAEVQEVQKEHKDKEPIIQTSQKQIHLDHQHVIKSPLVGTFYAASTPQGKPFVDVGTHVKKGQVVCIIEAMKIMNEIECDTAGVVEKIWIENGEPVEYGERLFTIRLD